MTPDLLAAGIFVSAIAVGAVGVGLSIWSERKRREALRRMAAERGFEFLEDCGCPPSAGGIQLLRRGHSLRYRNLMHGDWNGSPFEAYDYQYTVGSGKSSHTYRQTVAAFRRPEACIPAFELRKEHLGDKLLGLIGMEDIDFEENPAFSKKYHLSGQDVQAVRMLFTPNVLAWFAERPGWDVAGGGAWVVFMHHGRRKEPKEYWAFLEAAQYGFAFFGT
ncbi:MAG: hypothetical protein WC728_15265 [Elusimicrobiota bacterium]